MESSAKGCDNSGWCRRPGAPTTPSVTADLREPDKRATGSRLEGLGLEAHELMAAALRPPEPGPGFGSGLAGSLVGWARL